VSRESTAVISFTEELWGWHQRKRCQWWCFSACGTLDLKLILNILTLKLHGNFSSDSSQDNSDRKQPASILQIAEDSLQEAIHRTW